MSKLGRALFAVVFFLGIGIGLNRLAEQNVAASEIVRTGAWFVVGIVALFGALLGAGKLLGRLFRAGDK